MSTKFVFSRSMLLIDVGTVVAEAAEEEAGEPEVDSTVLEELEDVGALLEELEVEVGVVDVELELELEVVWRLVDVDDGGGGVDVVLGVV